MGVYSAIDTVVVYFRLETNTQMVRLQRQPQPLRHDSSDNLSHCTMTTGGSGFIKGFEQPMSLATLASGGSSPGVRFVFCGYRLRQQEHHVRLPPAPNDTAVKFSHV